jgi:hypothetical protein
VCWRVVGWYCTQREDTNISFTSIGLLWTVSDYLAKTVGVKARRRLNKALPPASSAAASTVASQSPTHASVQVQVQVPAPATPDSAQQTQAVPALKINAAHSPHSAQVPTTAEPDSFVRPAFLLRTSLHTQILIGRVRLYVCHTP